ncbi:hypothetical protein ACOMHN_040623 [Nucella lapillus]
MNQYGGFNFNNPGAGLATITPPVSSPGQVPVQMVPMSGLPPDLTCAMTPLPTTVQCPFCQSMTTTSTEKEAGMRAKLIACSLTLSCVCCLIPLCWNNLKDTVHYCGNCQREIGRCIRPQGTTGRMRPQ